MSRPRPIPPRPDLIRRPGESFGWLETRMLHEGILADLGPQATAVLTLLALAADQNGASYYGRGRMGAMLGMDLASVSRALAKLRERSLATFRPWRPRLKDGVWQLLPLPNTNRQRQGKCLRVDEILRQLGLDNERAGRE